MNTGRNEKSVLCRGHTMHSYRLSGECTTGVIQHFTSLAREELSVEQAKLEV